MAAPTLEVIVRLKDEMSQQLKTLGNHIEANQQALRKGGMILAGFGAAGVAAMGLMVRAAQEDERSVRSLSQALAQVGVSYASVKGQIDANVNALARNLLAYSKRYTDQTAPRVAQMRHSLACG